MENITMTEKDVRALESCDIITFQGFSGVWATVDQALAAPPLVIVHSSAGDVYDFERNADKTYTLKARN